MEFRFIIPALLEDFNGQKVIHLHFRWRLLLWFSRKLSWRGGRYRRPFPATFNWFLIFNWWRLHVLLHSCSSAIFREFIIWTFRCFKMATRSSTFTTMIWIFRSIWLLEIFHDCRLSFLHTPRNQQRCSNSDLMLMLLLGVEILARTFNSF